MSVTGLASGARTTLILAKATGRGEQPLPFFFISRSRLMVGRLVHAQEIRVRVSAPQPRIF